MLRHNSRNGFSHFWIGNIFLKIVTKKVKKKKKNRFLPKNHLFDIFWHCLVTIFKNMAKKIEKKRKEKQKKKKTKNKNKKKNKNKTKHVPRELKKKFAICEAFRSILEIW